MITNRTWRKSSHSNAESTCVELSVASTHTAIRDTKNRSGGELRFSREHYNAFLDAIKAR